MSIYCDPLFDLFLHTYKAVFSHGLFKNKDRRSAKTFNSRYHYIHDDLSLNNSVIIYISSTPMSLIKRILPTLQNMFLSLISAMEEDEKQDYATNVMASLFYKSTPHSSEAICWQHQCLEFTSRTCVRYTRTCAQCRDFMERGQMLT